MERRCSTTQGLPQATRRAPRYTPNRLTGHRLSRPHRKLLMIFENIDRDFIIALQRLPGAGTKRLHTTLHVGTPGGGVRLEVEPSLRQDAEKHPIVIHPI